MSKQLYIDLKRYFVSKKLGKLGGASEESVTVKQNTGNIIKKYEKMCKTSVKLNTMERSNEESHKHQDKVYRTFIKDICSGKLKSLNKIKKIATMIKTHVVIYDVGRWYA